MEHHDDAPTKRAQTHDTNLQRITQSQLGLLHTLYFSQAPRDPSIIYKTCSEVARPAHVVREQYEARSLGSGGH